MTKINLNLEQKKLRKLKFEKRLIYKFIPNKNKPKFDPIALKN